MLLQMLSCRLSMLRDLNNPGQATPTIKDIVLGPNLYLFLAKCAQMFLKFQRLLPILGHSCFNVKSSLSQLTRARQFGTTRCNVKMERSYPTNLIKLAQPMQCRLIRVCFFSSHHHHCEFQGTTPRALARTRSTSPLSARALWWRASSRQAAPSRWWPRCCLLENPSEKYGLFLEFPPHNLVPGLLLIIRHFISI